MRRAWVVGLALAALLGCGGGAREGERAETTTTGSEDAPRPPAPAAWLSDVTEGARLAYDVTRQGGVSRVQLDVQHVSRVGSSIAIRLAPVGTPLGEDPVYPRWLVGEVDALAALDETAGLTIEPGWSPLDATGHLHTEAAANVEWRVPERWLARGRALPGEEVSAGWTLAQHLGDVAEPIAARGCVRLERTEGTERLGLTVCASVGVLESSRTADDGTVIERWALASVGPIPSAGAETSLD